MKVLIILLLIRIFLVFRYQGNKGSWVANLFFKKSVKKDSVFGVYYGYNHERFMLSYLYYTNGLKGR